MKISEYWFCFTVYVVGWCLPVLAIAALIWIGTR